MKILINEQKEIVVMNRTMYPVKVLNGEWAQCNETEKQGYMVVEENCVYPKDCTLIEVAEVPNYVQVGKYIYEDGTFKLGQTGMTNEQLREYAYENMLYKQDETALILWEEKAITVDQANDLWGKYSAEGNAKANELSDLIVSAKGYIRELYPD